MYLFYRCVDGGAIEPIDGSVMMAGVTPDLVTFPARALALFVPFVQNLGFMRQ